MAANPVLRSRRIGSIRKLVCSHTPVRTRGSASSIITAVTPPMKSESGFLNTRHDTELGDTSAASPAGCEKIEGRTIDRFKQHPRCRFQVALQGPRQDDRCGHGNETFSVSTCYEPLLRFGN